MEQSDESELLSIGQVQPSPANRGRKKFRDPHNWKKNIKTRQLYSSKRLPTLPTCSHQNKNVYKCSKLNIQDVSRLHRGFYQVPNKQIQDSFILKYSSISVPKRSRKRQNGPAKTFVIKHNVPVRHKLTPICQKAFAHLLNVSIYRIRRVCKSHFKSGQMPSEKRGGDTGSRKNIEKLHSCKKFIESLSHLDSHYSRGHLSGKKYYVSSDLSIKKLHAMYNEKMSTYLNVKYNYFRSVFVKYYNIGFSSPATDKCSKCMELKEKLKFVDDSQKKTIRTELRIHKLRAAAFYKLLKRDDSNVVTISFDCQKNQVLPKLPDQSAYYLRQLYIYNLTFCEGSSKSSQNVDNTFIYCWTENEQPKGSNEVASALFHRLTQTNFQNKDMLRLFADGCAGQNKNTIMIGMLCKWFKSHAPRQLQKIIVHFPVVGHSFLPPDRIFGRIERILLKKEVIIKPEEYIDIFSQHGAVIRLGRDCEVMDWKSSTTNILKSPSSWHFQFQQSKRFILTKNQQGNVLVRGEPNFVADIGVSKTITKRGKKHEDILPEPSLSGGHVKPEKLKDVQQLLSKHFGNKWPDYENLSYYKSLIFEQAQHDEPHAESEEDEPMVDVD